MTSISDEQKLAMLGRMTAVDSLGGLLDVLGAELDALALADGYLINLLDGNATHLVTKKIRYMAEFASLEKTFLGYKNPVDDNNLNARTFASRSIVRVTLENASEAEAQTLRYWKVCEIVGVPIVAPGDVQAVPLGTLVLLKQGQPIEAQQFNLLQNVLGLFHHTLQIWSRYSQLEEMHDQAKDAVAENRRLLEFLEELNSLTSVDRIYQLFAEQLFRQLKFDIAGFSVADEERLVGAHIAIADPALQGMRDAWSKFERHNPFPIEPTESGAYFVFVHNEPLMFPDLRDIMHLQTAQHDLKILDILQKPRTLFMAPIRHQKKAIGVFALYSLHQPVILSEADLHLLNQLSSFLGAAITNSRTHAISQAQNIEIGHLNQMLQEKVNMLAEQASTDQLTGLFNYRIFEQELTKRLADSQRGSDKSGLALVLVDIDHFKRFNDTYGHAAGNDVLAGVAAEIDNLIRQTDMACRYGGEEFVVILPRCDMAGALLLAERIRKTIENRKFETEQGALSVTVSIGCAVYCEDDTRQTLFARVDQALYMAKNKGRNQVCSA